MEERRLTKEEFKELLLHKLDSITKDTEVDETVVSIFQDVLDRVLEEYKGEYITVSSEENIDQMFKSILPLLQTYVS